MPTTSIPMTMRTDQSNRAAHLLEHMQRIHNHDLPNEMVALQSLLQLLTLEEAKNLSGEGQEYLRRLQNAAKRASHLVRLLKEMGRVQSYDCAAEAVILGNLARELQGELHRAWPEKQLSFEWRWSTPAVFGDPRVLLHALVDTFKALYSGTGTECLVQATSTRHDDVALLAFRIQEAANSRRASTADETAARTQGSTERVEIAVAREWLALCGAELEVTHCDATGAAFRLTVPCLIEDD